MQSKKAHVIIVLGVFMALNQTACNSAPEEPEKTEAQKIVDGFKQKVDGDLQNHKSSKDVWPQKSDEYQEAGWLSEQDEVSPNYSVNVEKTDSLVSPYLGTVEFPVTGSRSHLQNSKEEALEATQVEKSYSVNHRLVYAYQNGQWVFKSEKCYYYDITVDGSTWRDCSSYDHGAHVPVMSTP